ncbi:hypothetical protein ABB37_02122 [Leptomonas pyrrhocoris]|uniref:Transmembrane protein n=1 Tax=Leptomonas pyrrhocoris TaxID=157538 RepID=A0A0N0VGV6_LEPPY|nr:hypothetical protein ABB37_02122 [Leptomonas pyrrhocoris]KPA83978.1 hypothetical protein ABB37_02122 [Leptomonas pyrrhocoris]|eukprot:XP_015662417.1 hypothetical protein ABB37_02122 [Leptomonas pyrrhocoris]
MMRDIEGSRWCLSTRFLLLLLGLWISSSLLLYVLTWSIIKGEYSSFFFYDLSPSLHRVLAVFRMKHYVHCKSIAPAAAARSSLLPFFPFLFSPCFLRRLFMHLLLLGELAWSPLSVLRSFLCGKTRNGFVSFVG